jgi:hypothetical protein
MIVITDLQGGGWDDWKFKNKKELKNFLQSESCSASGYSDKEYYKVNAHVSLDELIENDCLGYEIKETSNAKL